MLCNLWYSRAGDGVTSITRYRSGPVSPFLLSQPLCNLEPLREKKGKKRKRKKKEKGKEAEAEAAFQFLICCSLDYIQASCYDPSSSC